jgi:hypothetical protein
VEVLVINLKFFHIFNALVQWSKYQKCTLSFLLHQFDRKPNKLQLSEQVYIVTKKIFKAWKVHVITTKE